MWTLNPLLIYSLTQTFKISETESQIKKENLRLSYSIMIEFHDVPNITKDNFHMFPTSL